VDQEGDPVSLARKRQSTYARRKAWICSTPTVKSMSRIESFYDSSSQCTYHVECPHCHERIVLSWEGLKWDEGNPDSARYLCEHCGALIEEKHKNEMLAGGEWIAAHPERERVMGFHLNALYAPLGWTSWSDLVREYLDAEREKKRGNVEPMRTFVNARLALPYADGIAPSTAEELAQKAEDYELGTAPAPVLVLTTGCDVQQDRLEAFTWGWTRDGQAYLVDARIFTGSPAERGVWAELADYLKNERFPREGGGELRIAAAAIDAGFQAERVYEFTRSNRFWMAVKGSSTPGQPVISRPRAIEGRRGAQLRILGVDTIKTRIYGMLGVNEGPGSVHVTERVSDVVPDFFAQLVAERRVTFYRGGKAMYRCEKPSGARNEVLDAFCYAFAAKHAIHAHRYNAARWDQVEAQIAKAGAAAPVEKPAAPPPNSLAAKLNHPGFNSSGRDPWGRKNFVTGWRD
jgi:phage terminase large subunit GpA-like protein